MKRNKRSAIHSIFEECSKISQDDFWRDILGKCSYNKFPSGFMFKEGYLTHRRGKRITKIYLSEDPQEALEQIMVFFKEKDHICSDKDKEREEEEVFRDCEPLPEITDWNTLKKKKKLLEIVLNEFVRERIKERGLGKKERNQLTTVINIAMIQGYFTNDTVIMEKNCIETIVGLDYDEESGLFSLPTCERKIKVSKSTSRRAETLSSKSRNAVNFYTLWLDFLKKDAR
ncbi:hypothetical protein [Cedratvirus kamchatka]|uniref:Uncharacterized protein n=1 Tax=Cedratvirus kamchatka TaxID=2716914 RepID=A0A6G8MXT4_9VIRU|nr:hypothetical protein [Cedratvirus kamchatka]WIL04131.1 hypothetical protein Clen_201 [Cedratvirus lena]WIL04744.1 hypothetical protein Cduv_264 [Cedratvirus duvanny]